MRDKFGNHIRYLRYGNTFIWDTKNEMKQNTLFVVDAVKTGWRGGVLR